jgi:hypothetical protein
MALMAKLRKCHIVNRWDKYSGTIFSLSQYFNSFGSDRGAMKVIINGSDKTNNHKQLNWSLYAPDNIGPYIPTFSALILVNKLLNGQLGTVGARPCLDLFQLEDFYPYFNQYNINHKSDF